jgi:hypothetical protein
MMEIMGDSQNDMFNEEQAPGFEDIISERAVLAMPEAPVQKHKKVGVVMYDSV